MKPRHDVHPAPVVVVGAGIAGLATALELAPTPVLLLSRCRLGVDLASAWAQGGIAAALDPDDAPTLHAADTHTAGDGLCDPAAVELVTRMGPSVIDRLQRWGVEFDRDAAGNLALGREGGHGRRRIAHVRDATGAAVTHALSARAQASNSITILEGVEAEELLTDGGIVTGLAARRGAERLVFAARAVVLATGGVGGLYSHTSNPLSARGDGLAIAARAGAVLTDLEFVQFHPTAIDVGRDPMPLATEALRGEGALLVNDRGERFMLGQHELAELAPRDIVARAIWREREQGRRTYLDARTALGSRFAQRFPTVHAACRAAGIDPASELIPVAPAAHYHMGGIATDLHGASSLPGLWAVGECAGTGLHGANRLASNSLLEGVVFGVRAAAAIGGSERLAPRPRVPGGFLRQAREGTATADFGALRACMEAGVGVVRSRDTLLLALAQLAAMHARTDSSRPFANAVAAALMIAASALERHESRGGHCRSDFPLHAAGPAVRSRLTLAAAERIAAESAGAEPLPVARLAAG